MCTCRDCVWRLFLEDREALVAHAAAALNQYARDKQLTLAAMSRVLVQMIDRLNDQGADLKPKTEPAARDRLGDIMRLQTLDLSGEEVRVFSAMIPSMFPGGVHQPTAERATAAAPSSDPDQSATANELSEVYPHARFFIASDARLVPCAAEVLWHELSTGVDQGEDVIRCAISGGRLQSAIIDALPDEPVNRHGDCNPLAIVSLNDVHWLTRPELSADFISVNLAKKVGGGVFAVPMSDVAFDKAQYLVHLRGCSVFLLGCGGKQNSFVAELLSRDLDTVPDDFLGDLAYFPLLNGGDERTLAKVQEPLACFRMHGHPRFFAQRAAAGASVIVTVDQPGKEHVLETVLRRGMANRIVVTSEVAANLLAGSQNGQ